MRNLEAIRRRASAATPGPWKTGNRFGNGVLGSSITVLSGDLPPLELDPYRNGRNDAAFIAHARQDIPALISAIDQHRDAVDKVRQLHTDSVAGYCPTCFRAADVSDSDDGLVPWPCPTLQALGFSDEPMIKKAGK